MTEFQNSKTGKALKVREMMLQVAAELRAEGNTFAAAKTLAAADTFDIDAFARLHDMLANHDTAQEALNSLDPR